MFRLPAQAIFLLLEAALLAAFAISRHQLWLLPAIAILILLGSLQIRRTGWPGIAAAIAAVVFWIARSSSAPAGNPPVSFAVVALLLGTACAFLGILSSLSKSRPQPIPAALGRIATALHFAIAGIFLAAPHAPFHLPTVFAWASFGGGVVLALDSFAKLVGRLYTPRRNWDSLAQPGAFFFFRWLGKDWRACLPSRSESDDDSHLQLAEMWMWPVLRGKLPILLLASLLLVWITTSIHEIEVGKSGVRQTAGSWETSTLEPGFHLTLPWPLGGIQSIDTGKIHETVLGFRSDPGSPILWERAHYQDEQMSLVGGGDDLLSISVPVLYRIAAPADFLRGPADAEQLVRDAGNRVLLELTIGRRASEIMTTAREPLRHDFQQRLQAHLDRSKAGIRIEEICLRDVHPPVKVAPSFQEVLASMEEKEAMLHDGETYRREYSARARGEANGVVVGAESSAANRLAKVDGEMTRFQLRREAWERSPSLFEIREGFRIFDETLADTKKAIFDQRLRTSINTQLDLRRVLNPDLVDAAPAAPQTLVPRPARSREAFDLDIEGFLRMDQGEIPAVSSVPDDPDNLLKSNVPAK
jgi:regulator of protease activity HflC (stomatin/prohibitin superfamily)